MESPATEPIVDHLQQPTHSPEEGRGGGGEIVNHPEGD